MLCVFTYMQVMHDVFKLLGFNAEQRIENEPCRIFPQRCFRERFAGVVVRFGVCGFLGFAGCLGKAVFGGCLSNEGGP